MGSKEVRDDVVGTYEEYLKQFPDDNVERSRYAIYSYLCGLHTVSDEQFTKLGNDLVYFQQWPEKWTNQVRETVAAMAARSREVLAKARQGQAAQPVVPPPPPPPPGNFATADIQAAATASSSRSRVVAVALAVGIVLVVLTLAGVALLVVYARKKPAAARAPRRTAPRARRPE
jgi:hypothetical protein